MKVNERKVLSCNECMYTAMYYPDSFDDNTPIVVILTGDGKKGSKSDTWKPVIKGFLDVGFQVFIFDFHSQGNSAGSRTGLNLNIATQNYKDALNYLESEFELTNRAVALFGSSFGASVVLNLESYPSYVKGIIFKSPAANLAEAYVSEHETQEKFNLWKQSGISEVNGLSFEAFETASTANLFEKAKNIYIPTLIVHGDMDEIIPLDDSFRLKENIKGSAHVEVVEGCKHNYKQPGAYEALIESSVKFLQDLFRA